MTKKILHAKEITHPDLYQILDLKDVTFKWDKVTGKWTNFADSQGINYKKLFDSLESLNIKGGEFAAWYANLSKEDQVQYEIGRKKASKIYVPQESKELLKG